jgi:hypothetical protein
MDMTLPLLGGRLRIIFSDSKFKTVNILIKKVNGIQKHPVSSF